MRSMRLGVVWLAVAMLALAEAAGAQSTTGTISGRVVDAQELSVPGVTVTRRIAEPAGHSHRRHLRERRLHLHAAAVGAVHDPFELSGFQRQERVVTLAPTQVVPVDVTMGPPA